MSLTTSRTTRWKTDARWSHINWVILNADREAEFCRVAEAHPRMPACAKFTSGYAMEAEFIREVEARFNSMIASVEGA